MSGVLILLFLGSPWIVCDCYFLFWSIALLMKRSSSMRSEDFTEASPELSTHLVILIPVFNNSATVMARLIPALSSILRIQKQIPVAVMLVDSSTDGSQEVIRQSLGMTWLRHDEKASVAQLSNLTLIHLKKREGGKAWALNQVIQSLEVKYFGILDSDWVFETLPFLQGAAFLEYNPEHAYAQLSWKAPDTHRFNLVSGLDQVGIEYRHQLENRVRILKNIPVTIHGSAVVLRTESVQAVGGFNEDVLSEDVDLALRLLLAGWKGKCFAFHTMQEYPCDHFRQFFLQKFRWAEGRSQMLRRYCRQLLETRKLDWKQKLFWFYYLAYFGRCVFFAALVLASIATWMLQDSVAFCLSAVSLVGLYCLRLAGHAVTRLHGVNEIPWRYRVLEPLFFYGIGLSYAYTFFLGLFRQRGQWHVVEQRHLTQPAVL